MSIRTPLLARLVVLLACAFVAATQAHERDSRRLPVDRVGGGLSIMVLGSGGPVATRDRVSAGYLIFTDGRPRILMDAGGGVFQRIGRSGASTGGIEHILFSHLHMDHDGDLTPILAMSFFHNMAAGVVRDAPYRFVGPADNAVSPFPSTAAYLDGLFSPDGGLERYLAGFPPALGAGSFSYETQSIPADTARPMSVILSTDDGLVIKAIAVNHGPVPALAYRIEYGGRSIVYSGDTTSRTNNMITLSQNADLLIYDTAILDDTPPPFSNLHTTPTRIGEVAVASGVGTLLLSHITGITAPKLHTVKHAIRRQGFTGAIKVGHDLQVINLHRRDQWGQTR